MATLIALAALGLLPAGAVAALLGLLSVAIRREDSNLTLTGQATGTLTRLARRLNGVYVRTPRRGTHPPATAGDPPAQCP